MCNLMQVKHKQIQGAYKTKGRGTKLPRVEQRQSCIDRNSSKKVINKKGLCSNRFMKVVSEKREVGAGILVEILRLLNFCKACSIIWCSDPTYLEDISKTGPIFPPEPLYLHRLLVNAECNGPDLSQSFCIEAWIVIELY
jgi:hypothetical protein